MKILSSTIYFPVGIHLSFPVMICVQYNTMPKKGGEKNRESILRQLHLRCETEWDYEVICWITVVYCIMRMRVMWCMY